MPTGGMPTGGWQTGGFRDPSGAALQGNSAPGMAQPEFGDLSSQGPTSAPAGGGTQLASLLQPLQALEQAIRSLEQAISPTGGAPAMAM